MFTDNINNLTPTFRDAVEDFIPKWLESFVPHYHQAKVKNVDYADLSNVIFQMASIMNLTDSTISIVSMAQDLPFCLLMPPISITLVPGFGNVSLQCSRH